MSADGFIDQALQVFGVGDIARHGLDLPGITRLQGLQRVEIARKRDDPSSFFHVLLDDRFSDPAAGAGDDCDLAFKLSCHVSLLK